MADPIVRLDNVYKHFGGIAAVDHISFEIQRGEFFSMLGPSGCGKTTTLRMIGGFEQPDEGEIFLEGKPISAEPPYRRNVNTVFQSYALFEHLSVWDNVAFGLKRRRVPSAEINKRVGKMLAMVHLDHRARDKPRKLSGGQQQRVALARALVNLPAVLLLDEPLGALDLKLRKEMQLELLHLQREVGITFIYVTHDQEEAMTMSDRISIMKDGLIQQCGSPEEIYEQPDNAFVAGFMGISNLLPVTVEDDCVRLANGRMLPAARDALRGLERSAAAYLSIRPEKLSLGPPRDGAVAIEGAIADSIYLGMLTQYTIDIGVDVRLTATVHNGDRSDADHRLPPGTPVQVSWSCEQARVLKP